MTTPTRIERLQQAIAETARDLERAGAHASERIGPPAPGDLFVFDTGEEAALEWLVVREHGDDPGILLLAPSDDFPFAGPPDVELSRDIVGRPLTIRCGEALWVPAGFCQQRLRTGVVPAEALRLVRRKVAELARGRADASEEQRQADTDPEYEDWLGLVARARERLQQRADQAPIDLGVVIPFERLTSRLPAELAGEPQYALAAEAGGPLLTVLSEALAESVAAARYHEIDIDPSGKLILLATEFGVRAIGAGPPGVGVPKLLGRTESGEARQATWQTGPEGKLQRAEPIFPWIDGQVVLTIATDPPRTVTFHRSSTGLDLSPMTRSSHAASLAAVGDEGLWRTNPVWCIDRLLDLWGRQDRSWVDRPERLPALLRCLLAQGIRLPGEALQRWATAGHLNLNRHHGVSDDLPSPGVVGFVVDDSSATAWLVLLEVDPSRTWSVDSNLPIRPPTVLQDMLVRVVLALGLPQGGAVPERFAFDVRERLGRRSYGPSMHIAGLLAVIDRQNKNPPLLRRACAVVQPDGDRLVLVGGLDQKLGAFRRECGRGTLFVRPADCPEASAYDRYFEKVWEVGSFQDLAQCLERSGLLREFLNSSPLNAADVETSHSCLRRLTFGEHQYSEALDLGRRIQQCGYDPEVPARTAREIRRTIADLYRHLGYYGEAETLAQQEVHEAKTSKASSYDDQAQADAIHVASMYDPHRFTEMVGILEPWLEKLTSDRLLVSPETRVMVFNTLARARVILGRGEWAELFHRSEEILCEREPTDLPRTWNYLAHGLLRHGQLDEADAVIVKIEGCPALTGFSRWISRFLRAEYHRSRGQQWVNEEMEAAPGVKKRAGHPFGFYFQATARQPGRETIDAVGRFRCARDLFLQDAGSGGHPNILHFLADCMRLGEAGWGNEPAMWAEARRALARHLELRPGCGLDVYYAEVWKRLRDRPDRDAAEVFLRRIPFF